jgi:hypothetical protein
MMRTRLTRVLLLVALALSDYALFSTKASAALTCPSNFSNSDKFALVQPTANPAKMMAADAKNIKIIGGTIARPGDWPATFILCVSDGTFCTSTAVGFRVILTAAHCFDGVRTQDSIPIAGYFRETASLTLRISCLIDPEYRPFDRAQYVANGNRMRTEWSADVAICTVNADLPSPLFELVNSNASNVRAGDQLLLLGFGCTLSGGGGAVQTLYQGLASIKDIDNNTYYIHTMRDPTTIPSQAALCNGDSGGGSFRSSGKQRVSIGINSISDNRIDSWITDLSRVPIQQFLVQQSQQPELHICGIHPDARKCRSAL